MTATPAVDRTSTGPEIKTTRARLQSPLSAIAETHFSRRAIADVTNGSIGSRVGPAVREISLDQNFPAREQEFGAKRDVLHFPEPAESFIAHANIPSSGPMNSTPRDFRDRHRQRCRMRPHLPVHRRREQNRPRASRARPRPVGLLAKP